MIPSRLAAAKYSGFGHLFFDSRNNQTCWVYFKRSATHDANTLNRFICLYEYIVQQRVVIPNCSLVKAAGYNLFSKRV